MGIYFLWLIDLSLMCQFLFDTLGDSSSTLGLVAGPLILLFCYYFCYCCVRIRPPQFLTEDSSLTLWIRPLFSLLWFYPLSQGRFVYSDYRRLVSIVLVWIRPLLLIKPGFMAVINFYV